MQVLNKRHFRSEGYRPNDVPDGSEATSGPRTEPEVKRASPPTGAGRRLAAEMSEAAENWARGVRRELFDSPSPPFRTVKKAAAWVEREAVETRPEVDADRVAALHRQVTTLVQKLNVATRGRRRYVLEERPLFLSFQKPGSAWVHQVRVVSGTVLGRLQGECEDMHQATGFAHDALVMFVLIGGHLAFPTARVGSRVQNNRVEGRITILVPDLSFKQLRVLYRDLQRSLRAESAGRGLTERELKFLQLIKKHGDPPEKRTVTAGEYWRRIEQEGRKVEFKWNSYHGAMMMHRQVRKKLDDGRQAAMGTRARKQL